jgi:hypothetical protein
MKKVLILAAAGAVFYACGAGHALTASFEGAPASAVHATGNEAMANSMAEAIWKDPRQISCLDALWNRESGFSQYADTRVTGAGGDGPGSAVFAYGIAQARPASKYPKAGQPASMGGQSDPRTQVTWGLSHIASVYGAPCGALAHETASGWY